MFKNYITDNRNIEKLIHNLKEKFKDNKEDTILYFVSKAYDLDKLTFELNKAFPNTELIGGTTAGEIGTKEISNGGFTAMKIPSSQSGEIIYSLLENKKIEKEVENSFEKFELAFSEKMNEMKNNEYLGLALLDGLSGKEEDIMREVNKRTNVIFAGGSTGDDLQFDRTAVLINDKVHYDTSILMLMKPKVSFDIIKTQSFKDLDITLKPTKVEGRTVKEFNNQPALEVYKNLTDSKQVENSFMKYPIGLNTGEEIYVRSPQKVNDKGLDFYCNVNEGLELKLLESQDIVSKTKKDIKNKNIQLNNLEGEIQAFINFHCILRTLQLEEENKIKEYANLFNKPTLGFSTYGEVFLTPINQTSVIVVFGE